MLLVIIFLVVGFESWNDDAAWAQEDDILVEIVERRRTRSKLSYDDIVMKWREEEWNSIRNELRRLSNSKKKRTWKDVKNRFRKVIVTKLHDKSSFQKLQTIISGAF